jgi:hypothetical protein
MPKNPEFDTGINSTEAKLNNATAYIKELEEKLGISNNTKTE